MMTHHEIYDEEENLYRDSYYDEETGSLRQENTYTYDTNGNRIKAVEYNVEADYTVTFVYEYDDLGQKIKQVERNSLGDVNRIILYTYYSSGVRESEISYYGETTNKEMERQCYESGALKSDLYYDAEGNLTDSWYYDEEGNQINPGDLSGI